MLQRSILSVTNMICEIPIILGYLILFTTILQKFTFANKVWINCLSNLNLMIYKKKLLFRTRFAICLDFCCFDEDKLVNCYIKSLCSLWSFSPLTSEPHQLGFHPLHFLYSINQEGGREETLTINTVAYNHGLWMQSQPLRSRSVSLKMIFCYIFLRNPDMVMRRQMITTYE